MKKFIVIYHAPIDFMKESMNSTPEEMKKGMEDWMLWAKNTGKNLVDFGLPLMGGIKLSYDGGSTESKKEVCGYSILEADDMNHAKSIMQDHPHLKWKEGCEVEIHESMPVPG